jgi:hypothetical protein
MAKQIKADGTEIEVSPNGEFFSLDELQGLVGGLIEVVRVPKFDGDRTTMLVNENGLSLGLRPNEAATKLYAETHTGSALIVGNVVICESVSTIDGDEFR